MLIRRTLVVSVCDGVSLFERIHRHYLNPLILLTVSFSVFGSIDEWPVSVLYDLSSFGCRHRQASYPYNFALTAWRTTVSIDPAVLV